MIEHFVAIFLAAAKQDKPTPLEYVKLVAETFEAVVTGTALIVAGVWAYFRFVKERTYRPRIEVTLQGQWLILSEGALLLVHVAVKNIGASVIELKQKGTALKVIRPTREQPPSPSNLSWQEVKEVPSWEIFLKHQWVEPNETISNDVLIDLAVEQPVLALLWCRLVWHWRDEDKNIDVVTSRVLSPPGAVIAGAPQGEPTT